MLAIISKTLKKYFDTMVVLLDNGHGQETPGKRSPKWSDGKQLFEWEWVRRLVKAIATQLKQDGIESEIIVPENTEPGLSVRANRANKLVQKYGANNCIFISVHGNAGGGKGWEVFSTTKKNKSDVLAECFTSLFSSVFPNRHNRGHKEADFTVIYKTNCPAVLTENFFYDNEEECHYMLSNEGFDKIVELHVLAIEKYIRENTKE